jgi:hypothetical protein
MLVPALLAALTLPTTSTPPAPAAEDSIRPRSTVVWTPETFEVMRFLYQRITAGPGGVEFAACLRARREGGAWVVREVVVPWQSGNSSTGIESADCTGYEGTAHSHPLHEGRRACLPSFGDRATFAASSNEFMVIWCDSEAFTFRTRDLGIGGKDDVSPDPTISTSAERHLWRSPLPATP